MLWGLKTCRVESYSRALWSLERGLCWRKEWKIEREGWRGGTAQSSVSAAMSKCGGVGSPSFSLQTLQKIPRSQSGDNPAGKHSIFCWVTWDCDLLL